MRLKKSRIMPLIFLLLWSSGTLAVHLGLKYTNPFSFLFLRYLIATILIMMILICWKYPLEFNKRNIPIVIGTALLQQTIYQTFFFISLSKGITPGLLSIILGIQPIITAIISNKNISKVQWIGLLFGFAGLIIVVYTSAFNNQISILGIFCGVIAMVSITVGTITQKKLTISMPMNLFIQSIISLLFYTVFIVFFGKYEVEWHYEFIIALIWMSVVISIFATFLLYYMIRKGELVKVTSLFYFIPGITAILDYMIFRNILEPNAIIGLIFVIIGTFLINNKIKLSR